MRFYDKKKNPGNMGINFAPLGRFKQTLWQLTKINSGQLNVLYIGTEHKID
jgi:hypothetical protein